MMDDIFETIVYAMEENDEDMFLRNICEIDINAKGFNGYSLLTHAFWSSNSFFVEKIVKLGANVNNKVNGTPEIFHCVDAIVQISNNSDAIDDIDKLEILVNAGVDLSQKDDNDESILDFTKNYSGKCYLFLKQKIYNT
ncbi:hypothetical protein [Flammeovirga sp. SJP92]|uniref:hypothetical protein n=1 Tax=Flammeovirga sp. SJP92 TaxID=1775430 RepID=UPI000787ADE9|nr:hypothetical protein [Flammeovirga sp. SJP92]KXX69230.1 hypothetical protein AVL50_16335 [Flammeovirga sp. SJP92]